MKKLIASFAVILLMTALQLSAQPWMKPPYLSKDRSEATFKDIQKAFYSYWDDSPYVRGKGYKQFKRWEYLNEPHCFPDGKVKAAIKYMEVYEAAVAEAQQYRQTTVAANWIPLGISSWQLGYSGYNPGNGRVNFVAQHPTNPDIIYIASPSGGIWKTTDGGITWNTTYDQMTRLGTSCIAIHPLNPDTVFIGTGDKDSWDTEAFGIQKSHNGGLTWQNGGLNTGINYNNINKILINPQNPQVMLAATPERIYRSVNGGANWTQVYNGNNDDIRCMVYKPGDTTTVYCGGAMFLKSTNGGLSFTENTTLPTDTSRLEIGVSAANSNYVYVLASSDDNTFGGLYRSTDNGDHFALMSTTPNILGYSVDSTAYTDDAGQAWYDLAIAVSPLDANTIFTGGINIWKSTDGGANWAPITNWYVDPYYQYTHADIHYLGFYGDRFYCGSDGGVFVSDDYGDTWTDLSPGLEITQFYAFANSQTNSQMIVAGAQDNGSNVFLNGTWTHAFGADGFEALTYPGDDNTFYCSYQNGGILRTYDGGDNFDYINTTGQDGAWLTPIAMSPVNASVIWMGLEDMWKSTDGGDNWINTTNGMLQGEKIDEMAIAPGNPLYVYFSNRDSLYISKNNGNSWTAVQPASGYYITGIAVSEEDEEKIWISMSSTSGDRVYKSINAGDSWISITGTLSGVGLNCIIEDPDSPDGLYVGTETGIFYRDTTMTAWEAFDANLPKVIVRELEIVSDVQRIRAATYGRGIWESHMYTWNALKENKKFVCNIYPNPATKLVTIDLQNDANADLLRIFNAGGSLIQTINIAGNKQSVDVSGLPTGNYYFRIEKNGEVLGTQKVTVVSEK
ncbi:MAG TPA: T9SS type A sorting domain-containing protein [Bacteroidales bacterium]|nr:T9SS type A sorting domain-containing protein [Bacteroidales bacterium]